MTKALITGGAGFIGSHLAEILPQRGWPVVVLDDLSTGSIKNVVHLKTHPGFSYVLDSVMNRSLMLELIDQADVVFHLAAAVGVRLIVEGPVRTIETNIKATELLLDLSARKQKPILLTSTSVGLGAHRPVVHPTGASRGHPRRPGGRPRGGKLRMAGFCGPDLEATPVASRPGVVMRWAGTVTGEAGRAPLGLEPQQPWSDRAIARTTPVRSARCARITVLAWPLRQAGPLPVSVTAWDHTPAPPFAACWAWVRQQLWRARDVLISAPAAEIRQVPREALARVLHGLPSAA
jgi:hypothetical protein